MLRPFNCFLIAMTCFASQGSFAETPKIPTETLKKQILDLAKAYAGRPDPDQKLQQSLEVLANELINQNPMPPVSERISLIAGAWKQVWGPYDYRNDDGGIDPTLGLMEIHQVVFAEGYYYNVAPYYPNGDKTREQIGMLRGEFVIDPLQKNSLRVRFTDYPGVESRPTKYKLWELPALAEAGSLENAITIVPSWVVKQYFKGGTLDEVYTDRDLRIVYGMKTAPSTRRFLYIMSRVN